MPQLASPLREEWALLRGQCPAGGLRVTGYAPAAARYCAMKGGRYAITGRRRAADEDGVCTLPGGTACGADAYYGRTCAAASAQAPASSLARR